MLDAFLVTAFSLARILGPASWSGALVELLPSNPVPPPAFFGQCLEKCEK